MSRRRYLSTEISSDPIVAELAEAAGPWAVVLYTWLIPHAEDDGSVPGDPGKLKLQVVPGFELSRDVLEQSLAAMLRLGLLVEGAAEKRLYFPPGSFYRHQSYIKEDRRTTAQIAALPGNAAKAAQIAASSSFSSSSPVPVSSSVSSPVNPPGPPSQGGAANGKISIQVGSPKKSGRQDLGLSVGEAAHAFTGRERLRGMNPRDIETLAAAWSALPDTLPLLAAPDLRDNREIAQAKFEAWAGSLQSEKLRAILREPEEAPIEA